MNVPRRLTHRGSRNQEVGDRVAESDLGCNKPEVSEYNKKEEEMKGFDP